VPVQQRLFSFYPENLRTRVLQRQTHRQGKKTGCGNTAYTFLPAEFSLLFLCFGPRVEYHFSFEFTCRSCYIYVRAGPGFFKTDSIYAATGAAMPGQI